MKGIKAVDAEEAKRMTKAIKLEADFIEGKDGQTLNKALARQ